MATIQEFQMSVLRVEGVRIAIHTTEDVQLGEYRFGRKAGGNLTLNRWWQERLHNYIGKLSWDAIDSDGNVIDKGIPLARVRELTGKVVGRVAYFYRAHFGRGGSQRELPFDSRELLDYIGKLSFSAPDGAEILTDNNGSGRYLFTDEGNTRLWVKVDTGGRVKFQFGKTNLSAFPQKEKLGELSPIDMGKGEGLAELTYCVIFPRDVVGVISASGAPNMKAVSEYLLKKGGSKAPETLVFDMLVRGNSDVKKKLNDLKEYNSFTVKIRKPYAAVQEQLDPNAGQIFGLQQDIADPASHDLEVDMAVTFTAIGTDKADFNDKVKKLTKDSNLRSSASQFEVKGISEDTNKVTVVDLIRDKLAYKMPVACITDSDKVLKNKSVYEAIEVAYAKLKPEIEKAIGIS